MLPLIPIAAVGGVLAVLFFLVPPAWGRRVWLTSVGFLVSWHLSGMHNDVGEGLGPGPLSTWVALVALAGAIGGYIGVAVRAAKGSESTSPRAATRINTAMALIAMLPIGGFVINLGSLVLAGTTHPWVWHLALVAVLLVMAALAGWTLRGVAQGLVLGVALSTLWATVDSLRFEHEIRANLSPWDSPGMQTCLGTGWAGRALTDQRPLTKLTAERPVMLRVEGEPDFASSIWSFGDRSFIGLIPQPRPPACEPSTDPILAG